MRVRAFILCEIRARVHDGHSPTRKPYLTHSNLRLLLLFNTLPSLLADIISLHSVITVSRLHLKCRLCLQMANFEGVAAAIIYTMELHHVRVCAGYFSGALRWIFIESRAEENWVVNAACASERVRLLCIFLFQHLARLCFSSLKANSHAI
jgi:hypothetical protein